MYPHRLLLMFLFVAFLLLPAVMDLWLFSASSWPMPYIIWFALILFTALMSHRRHDL
jgi:hypothetical protein